MSEFFMVHKGNIVPLELYTGSDHQLKAKCLHCGNEMIKVARFYIGVHRYGCKHCKNASHGENIIQDWLEANAIEFKRQVSFDDLRYYNTLFYDFAVFDKDKVKCLIEYDGEQHFKPVEHFGGEEHLNDTLLRDEIKNNYAIEKGIKLIRISYKQKKNITKILSEIL